MRLFSRRTERGERLHLGLSQGLRSDALGRQAGAGSPPDRLDRGEEPILVDFAQLVEQVAVEIDVQTVPADEGQVWLRVRGGSAVPHTLLQLLESGDAWWQLALRLSDRAQALLASDRQFSSTGRGDPLPILVRPVSVRDFYAFEEHVRKARAQRGLEMVPEWYQFPAFYFSNALCMLGDEDVVFPPRTTRCLDLELEAALVVRKEVRDAQANELLDVTAGLTLMNDWSARDVQREEVKVGLGPAKGKDFATSLGPCLVTWDELSGAVSDPGDGRGPRVDLHMRAVINGRELTQGNLRDLYFTLGELVARASEGVTLHPGEVIGTGTVGGGCILEWGEATQRWLLPGDEVSIAMEGVGRMTNRIGDAQGG
ncbi:MAG: fumarylacetoacetate hydrolase family protein [Firmicutes bacterium]|nr:fumarylacetoacetate hydrolase family protein [Bacillota bacterium]